MTLKENNWHCMNFIFWPGKFHLCCTPNCFDGRPFAFSTSCAVGRKVGRKKESQKWEWGQKKKVSQENNFVQTLDSFVHVFFVRRKWEKSQTRQQKSTEVDEIINKQRKNFSFNHHLIRGELFATSQNCFYSPFLLSQLV